jgi:tRNA(fMet)-specific endonuclease VapC
MKELLLDTDTVSFFLKGIPQVKSKFEITYAAQGYFNISIMTYYEIMNGLIFKDARRQLESFEGFTALCRILPINVEIALIAASTYADLRRKNLMIGHADVLIGATALHYDLQIITNNQDHFQRIPGLELDNWV